MLHVLRVRSRVTPPTAARKNFADLINTCLLACSPNGAEDDQIGTFKVNLAAVSAKLSETGMSAIRTWFEVMPKGSVQCTFSRIK